jgi:hypothetical protein
MERINPKKAKKAYEAYMGVKINKVTVYPSPQAAILARQSLPEDDRISMNNVSCTQSDVDWISFCRFVNIECGVDLHKKDVENAWKLAQNAHYYWVVDDELILVERPIEMHFQETGTLLTDSKTGKSMNLKILHSTEGMAVQYGDGTGVYAIGGLTLNKEFVYIVKEWDDMTPDRIFAISNVEIRQAAIAAYGPSIYTKLPHRVLDTYVSVMGGVYTLYEIEYPNNSLRVALKGNCPSKGDSFFEFVHPEARTCQMALNWREEDHLGEVYTEPLIRT